ncbi:hypothetical protein SAMN04488021_11866 [Paracoccus aminovorans]|uniref:Uncharacterized protein n=1 Tax=Paracoccus aminovorans TaxID=34004 RepID=A0A1I3B1L2_9RHOB|nr:hypothetical protein [Paracoccus aminovorans]SFH55996.1 hypothetical protein SAMN04488021_11866 [Paracoccus aminovorans]
MAARKRFAPTEATTLRAIEFVRKAGLRIAAVEFPRDGMVRVITSAVDMPEKPEQDDRKPEPWT